MTEYQPGRIYSGVVLGKRRLLFCGRNTNVWFSWVNDHGMLRFSDLPGDVTDIRGPLAVLDLHDFTASTVRDLTGPLRDAGWNGIADQIEAQTRPPLQVGWHECHLDNALPRVLWWDGERFLHAPHGSWVDKWRSVAYLGKGTRA